MVALFALGMLMMIAALCAWPFWGVSRIYPLMFLGWCVMMVANFGMH